MEFVRACYATAREKHRNQDEAGFDLSWTLEGRLTFRGLASLFFCSLVGLVGVAVGVRFLNLLLARKESHHDSITIIG